MAENFKDRETLYKMMISQLWYDGLDLVAQSLAKCVGLEEISLAASSRLIEVMKLGLQAEREGREPEMSRLPGLTPLVQPEANGIDTNVKVGLDLEYERDVCGSRVHAATTVDSTPTPCDEMLSARHSVSCGSTNRKAVEWKIMQTGAESNCSHRNFECVPDPDKAASKYFLAAALGLQPLVLRYTVGTQTINSSCYCDYHSSSRTSALAYLELLRSLPSYKDTSEVPVSFPVSDATNSSSTITPQSCATLFEEPNRMEGVSISNILCYRPDGGPSDSISVNDPISTSFCSTPENTTSTSTVLANELLEKAFSTNESILSPDANKYTDCQVDFLFQLGLIPTPLVRDCPNTTRKWLTAGTDCIDVSMNGTTGINVIHDGFDNHDINFECLPRESVESFDRLHLSNTVRECPSTVSTSAMSLRELFTEYAKGETCNEGLDDGNGDFCAKVATQICNVTEFSNAEESLRSCVTQSTAHVIQYRLAPPVSGFLGICDMHQEMSSCTTSSISDKGEVSSSTISAVFTSSPRSNSQHLFSNAHDTSSSFVFSFVTVHPSIMSTATSPVNSRQHLSSAMKDISGSSSVASSSATSHVDPDPVLVSPCNNDHAYSSPSYEQLKVPENVSSFGCRHQHSVIYGNNNGNVSSVCSHFCSAPIPTDPFYVPSQSKPSQYDFTELKSLVLDELHNHGITQAIFAQASIGKSQGYLSDLLNKASQFSPCSTTLSRASQNLKRICDFLKLSSAERSSAYLIAGSKLKDHIGTNAISQNDLAVDRRTCVDQTTTHVVSSSSINSRCMQQKRKRTFISAEQKMVLMQSCYEHVNDKQLLDLAERTQLDVSVVRTFLRNCKHRRKHSQ